MKKVIQGDCIEVLKTLEENSVDAVVTDPPYNLSTIKRFSAEDSGEKWCVKEGVFHRSSKGFMGKEWDNEVAFKKETWREVYRVLKPGGHLLSFGGTRTFHRMACAIEDAGFEIRDMVEWVYGSGFPKSLDIAKQIDKRGGKSVSWFGKWLREWREKENIPQKEVSKLFPSKTGGLTGCVANWELGLNMPTNEQFNLICKSFNLPFESLEETEREFLGTHNFGASSIYGSDIYNKRENGKTVEITKGTSEWEGWGTALKPAHEPICMARKPLGEKTVAENCLKYGTGGINIDESRVDFGSETDSRVGTVDKQTGAMGKAAFGVKTGKDISISTYKDNGRFPANLIHDNGEEVRECFPENSARFFKSIIYTAKASKSERNMGCENMEGKFMDESREVGSPGGTNPRNRGAETKRSNFHPTVKPIALMEYLIKMVSKEGAVILDPFAGSCTTLLAARNLNRNYIGIEKEPEYVKICEARLFEKQERMAI